MPHGGPHSVLDIGLLAQQSVEGRRQFDKMFGLREQQFAHSRERFEEAVRQFGINQQLANREFGLRQDALQFEKAEIGRQRDEAAAPILPETTSALSEHFEIPVEPVQRRDAPHYQGLLSLLERARAQEFQEGIQKIGLDTLEEEKDRLRREREIRDKAISLQFESVPIITRLQEAREDGRMPPSARQLVQLRALNDLANVWEASGLADVSRGDIARALGSHQSFFGRYFEGIGEAEHIRQELLDQFRAEGDLTDPQIRAFLPDRPIGQDLDVFLRTPASVDKISIQQHKRDAERWASSQEQLIMLLQQQLSPGQNPSEP